MDSPALGKRARTQRVLYSDDMSPTQKARHGGEGSQKVTPPDKRAKKVTKGAAPDFVTGHTVLTNARQLASLLQGSDCRADSCRGKRSITNFQTEGLGGCAVYTLFCDSCKTTDLFETGTHSALSSTASAHSTGTSTKRQPRAPAFIQWQSVIKALGHATHPARTAAAGR